MDKMNTENINKTTIDQDELNIAYTTETLRLLRTIEHDINSLAKTYTKSIMKETMTEEMFVYILNRIHDIKSELDSIMTINGTISSMRPEGDFKGIELEYNHVFGKYEMLNNIINTISDLTKSKCKSDGIDIVI